MERLSHLDAEFLHLEDVCSPMHIGCVSIFEGPTPTQGEVLRLFEAKLARIPRYRQRVRALPLELGRPAWIDDVHFDLDYHVRRTALPSPHDDAALCTLMGRVMAQCLDREKPLWEAWIVEGLPNERWALISKIHHCMVDGISGIDLLAALLDRDRVPHIEPAAPWFPEPEPSASELIHNAWEGLSEDSREWLEKLRTGLKHPESGARAVFQTSEGLVAFARHLTLTPKLSIEGEIGPHRCYAHASVALTRVMNIRKELGGTINDVVLAAVSAGYRTLLLERGEDLANAKLRCLVPVSVRTADARGVPDNRVSAVLCDLPVHLKSARERFDDVRRQMLELKTSGMAEAGEWVTELFNLAPPMLVGSITRLIARIMHQLPQRSINTVVTNVPGPPFPLYFLGRQMLESHPYVPITQGVRIGTAVLSYNGQLAFGVTGDYDHARDVDVLARAIVDGVEELSAISGVPEK